VPLQEKVFRRLYALQAVMVNALPHTCALNPRAFRLMEYRGFLEDRKRMFLDGELLWRYVSLDVRTQEDLAEVVGITRDVVLDNLLEIEMLSNVI
jgi:hypothetical protein